MFNKVREVRLSKGISQAKLSGDSGISRTVISKLECNESVSVNTKTIVRIAEALGVAPEEIFFF